MKKGYCMTCYWYEVGYDWYLGGYYAECHNPELRKLPLEEIDDDWGINKPCPFWKPRGEDSGDKED